MHANDAQTVHTCQTQSVCKPQPPAYIQGSASISTITSDPRPVFEARLLFKEIQYINDGAPPIGQRLGIEVKYRPADEGQSRDGLIFDAHTDVLHFCTECNYSKNVKFYKVKAYTHYYIYGPYMYA